MNKRVKVFLFAIVAVALTGSIAAILITCIIKQHRVVAIKPYYEKGELERSIKNTKLNDLFADEKTVEALPSIEISRFMSYVPVSASGYKSASSHEIRSLDQFDSLFGIHIMTIVKDNEVASVFKLSTGDDIVYAVPVFEKKQLNMPDNTQEEAVYDYWEFCGKCYYYSPTLNSHLNTGIEDGDSFKEFADDDSCLGKVFLLEPHDVNSNYYSWSASFIARDAMYHVVFGLESAEKNELVPAIEEANLIEVSVLSFEG